MGNIHLLLICMLSALFFLFRREEASGCTMKQYPSPPPHCEEASRVHTGTYWDKIGLEAVRSFLADSMSILRIEYCAVTLSTNRQTLPTLRLPSILIAFGFNLKADVQYRVTRMLGKNLPLTWIWDVLPSCLGSRQLQ